MQASDYDKIIHTAFMVSKARQFTDIPYAKELAQLVEAQRLVELSGSQNQDKSALLTARVEARYKAINQVMAQYQIGQVLELASGLLPRGLFMSCHPNITFIESDLPRMIRCKQQLVDPSLQKLLQTGTNLTGRSLVDNNFTTLEQARQFAYEQGFRVAEHSMLNVMDQLSCLKILGIDTEVVRKMLALWSIFALTLDVA